VCGPCVEGRPSLCLEGGTPGTAVEQGAFAGYVAVPPSRLLRLPAGLGLREAALAEPLAVALHALTQAGPVLSQPGVRALVTGAGPIGALVLAALVARGVGEVVVVEPAPARAALARRLGASAVVAPDDLDVPSIAEPRRLVEGAVDVAFECSGKAVAMVAALAQLGRRGRLVLVGAGIEPPRFDPNRILLNELVVTGSFEYDAGGLEAALELLASGVLPLAELVEPDDVGLGDLLGAMESLASGTLAGKVLVDPWRDVR
jgi:threonine dehydrogenase-like Zn-dependent dehydrogenase